MRDAVNVAPGIPLPGNAAVRGARYIGTSHVLQAVWSVTPRRQVNLGYAHAAAGPVIARAGGQSLDHAAFWTTLRF